MPTVTIDGQQITVERGTRVIAAAEALGIYIPRYCYHPGLTVAASCRMCLVQIERAPKLEASCYTQVADGMVVRTDTEAVRQARSSVLEFLLSNHPLDCPVCDQAGECDLQNFYMDFGLYQSRYLENKIKRRKAYPIGPHVMLDNERCILCSRCVRFCDEISGTRELGIVNRGENSEIALIEGTELNNPYSGNVIDICPVGALTERDFRFQCRVWYLRKADSICPGCSRGCNIEVHYNVERPYQSRGRRILRLKPRFNPDVNRWWMCDEGRYGFAYVDATDRIGRSLIRDAAQGERAVSPGLAAETASAWIQGEAALHGAGSVGFFVSARLASEELFALRRLVDSLGSAPVEYRNPSEKPGYQDDLLIRADRNPNTWTCREMGLFRKEADDGAWIAAEIEAGRLRTLIVFLHDLALDPAFAAALPRLEKLIFVGSNHNATAELAGLVLASAPFTEKSGSFANFEGRVQRFERAVEPLGESLPELDWILMIAAGLGLPAEVFERQSLLAELYERMPAARPPEPELVYQQTLGSEA